MDLGNLYLESHGMFKLSLMGQPSSIEEVEGQLNCVSLLAQKVSVEKNFNMRPKDCFM